MTPSPLSKDNLYLFNEGTQYRAYQMLGAHCLKQDGVEGVRFALWAPHAKLVQLVGEFNAWEGQHHVMKFQPRSGIWQLFVPHARTGMAYKYVIHAADGEVLEKSDPYAVHAETPPKSASVVWELGGYDWQDALWQEQKKQHSIYESPVLIYEVHLGSWRRAPGGRSLTYRELAEQLVPYAAEMGYTHIELLPLAEHPFDGSWGYQITGFFAVTSRYGTPQDFMYFVDCCHQQGLGVIMDWVPGHFCRDGHGLRRFDGTPLYEHPDPLQGENEGWGTCNFDYGRPEVKSFLISNALFWLDVYHIDGLRADAVANILYLDYGRKKGQWRPNRYGGNGNLEGMALLRQINETVFREYPQALMMAEESTSWPMVSWPTDCGGLGFNFKWNMGWMNDMLRYMELDPIHRKWYHNLLTFSLMYAFTENFVLPLSHDEVVHGKKSLLNKMPGDYWQKFANLRAFYAYWLAHPGKKLLFMGGEFGQFIEWKHDDSLDWHLLDYPQHRAMHHCVRELNRFYREHAAFWENDDDWDGFSWLDCQDYEHSVISFLRRDRQGESILVVCNFTPVVREGYRIGVPAPGEYHEVLNTDAGSFGGSGQGNGVLYSEPIPWHSQDCSVVLRLPPLATVYLRLRAVETEQKMTKDTRGNGYV